MHKCVKIIDEWMIDKDALNCPNATYIYIEAMFNVTFLNKVRVNPL